MIAIHTPRPQRLATAHAPIIANLELKAQRAAFAQTQKEEREHFQQRQKAARLAFQHRQRQQQLSPPIPGATGLPQPRRRLPPTPTFTPRPRPLPTPPSTHRSSKALPPIPPTPPTPTPTAPSHPRTQPTPPAPSGLDVHFRPDLYSAQAGRYAPNPFLAVHAALLTDYATRDPLENTRRVLREQEAERCWL